jgi:hypothetical protein
VGSRPDLIVAMDWTDFDADGQATLALKLMTRHGRATGATHEGSWPYLQDLLARSAVISASLFQASGLSPTSARLLF